MPPYTYVVERNLAYSTERHFLTLKDGVEWCCRTFTEIALSSSKIDLPTG